MYLFLKKYNSQILDKHQSTIKGTHLDMMDHTAILQRAKIDAQDSLLYHSAGSISLILLRE